MSWKDKYILKQPGKLMGELMGKKESNPSPPGMRKDAGKTKWHLIPIPAMVAFVKVWHGGAIKYEEEQWRGGMKFTRIYRPMMSHLNKWLCGKGSYDKELGTHHLMMVAWGCFVLYMYEIIFERDDLDDRPDKGLLNDEDFDYENILDVVMWQKAKEEDRLRRKDEKQRNRDWKDFKEDDWKDFKEDAERQLGDEGYW
jgi:hypothetical protein